MTLSQCRLRLRQLTQELNKLIMIFLRRKILIKGGVCLTRSRCGKVNCRCVKDDALHLAWKLYWTEDGKTRQKTIGKGVVYDYQRLMGNYLRFRKARARFVKIYQEMIQLINLLEKGMTKSSIKSYWTRR
ncbi:MAG: DUF6788 family protein [bacterium]